jgi:hypothetical protein
MAESPSLNDHSRQESPSYQRDGLAENHDFLEKINFLYIIFLRFVKEERIRHPPSPSFLENIGGIRNPCQAQSRQWRDSPPFHPVHNKSYGGID